MGRGGRERPGQVSDAELARAIIRAAEAGDPDLQGLMALARLRVVSRRGRRPRPAPLRRPS